MPGRKSFHILLALLALIGLAWAAAPVLAQDATPQYTLNVHKTFGFNNGSQIRGQFSAEMIGPDAIQPVTFLLDGKPIGQAAQVPFKFDFNTSSYPVGWHDMTASVTPKDGTTFITAARHFEFISADQESTAMRNILGPMLGGIALLLLVIYGVQFLIFRNRPNKVLPLGAARNYGMRGGAICPRCHRPFPIHWFAMNMGIGFKFDRCDFCGRQGFFKPVSRDELARAEAAELEMTQPDPNLPAESEKDKLKKILDDSRFTDNH
jgi:hypothetical protein